MNLRPASKRLDGLDATRAVALIGVVVMNFHGYLNGSSAAEGTSFVARLFDPWDGVLSTRFAATFVTLAGIGATLLTNRSRISGDAAAISADRWRLARRGFLLLAFGYTFEWVWPGTILYYYGAYFLIAALVMHWRIRTLLAGAVVVAVASAAFAAYAHNATVNGDEPPAWYYASGYAGSHKDLVLYTIFNGTHPLLPWLAFFFVGMVLGRLQTQLGSRRWRVPVVAVGVMLLGGGYALSATIKRTLGEGSGFDAVRWHEAASTSPFSRALLYTATTIGSSMIAVVVLPRLFDGIAQPLGRALAPAGRMTLTIYVLHALVFNAIVGTDTTASGLALVWTLAGCFWLCAVGTAFGWEKRASSGLGPLEWVYRRFGG